MLNLLTLLQMVWAYIWGQTIFWLPGTPFLSTVIDQQGTFPYPRYTAISNLVAVSQTV